MSTPQKRYVGIDNDEHGGLTDTGRIIRDAWVFGILPEEETCRGWTLGQLNELYDKVSAAWAPYGHLVSKLPQDFRERHRRIYTAAVRRARETGWDPELDENEA